MIFKKDLLTVNVAPDRAELGVRAGKAAAEAIRAAIARRGEARVIFAAAPSQNETLATLVAEPGVDWTKVVALHMDEYVGLPIGSEARFSYYFKKHCFELVPFKAVYYIVEQTGLTVDEMKRRYEAFNDPPVADFNDPEAIKVVELDDACRRQQVNDGCFPDFDSTPTHALTLTVPTLASGAVQICAVPGKFKAAAVKRTLEGPVATECPATVLRTLPNATLFVDADSYPGA